MEGRNDIGTVICIVIYLIKFTDALNFLCLRSRDIVLFIEKCARNYKKRASTKQHFGQIPLTGHAGPVEIGDCQRPYSFF
jgi:hypothetical protein